MTAQEQLAKYGVTLDVAREWIMATLEYPETIFTVAQDYGITCSMLAEIVEPMVPGVTASVVEQYFDDYGLNGSALNDTETLPTTSDGSEFLPEQMAELSSLVTMNANTGTLSTATLRNAVLGQLANDAYYYEMFSPAGYSGSADNVFTGEELGIAGMSSFEATTENLESLYYGTIINVFKSIDMSEIMEISNFATTNAAAIQSGNTAVMSAYMDLIISVLADPANPPIYTDALLSQSIVTSTVMAAELVGAGDTSSLFDNLLTSFMPS